MAMGQNAASYSDGDIGNETYTRECRYLALTTTFLLQNGADNDQTGRPQGISIGRSCHPNAPTHDFPSHFLLAFWSSTMVIVASNSKLTVWDGWSADSAFPQHLSGRLHSNNPFCMCSASVTCFFFSRPKYFDKRQKVNVIVRRLLIVFS